MLIFLGKNLILVKNAHLQTKIGGNGRGPKRSNLMLNSLLKFRNFRLSWTPRQRHILEKKVKQGVLAIFKTADVETGKFKNTSLYIFYPLGNTLCKRLFIHIREFLAEPNTLCMFIFSVAVYQKLRRLGKGRNTALRVLLRKRRIHWVLRQTQ